jgi:UbiD family decarboxylase
MTKFPHLCYLRYFAWLYTKWIIAVDDDIDPTDTDQVIWA